MSVRVTDSFVTDPLSQERAGRWRVRSKNLGKKSNMTVGRVGGGLFLLSEERK